MRQPITLKIKFKSASLDQFIERYSVDVSRGGIFIRTKEPLKVGTQLKFEFQLQDASALISGEGTVVWIREHDPARTGVAPGMGVRFDKLAASSNAVLEQILTEKARRGEAQVESRFDAGVRASASASGTLTARKPSDFDPVDSKAGTPLPKPAPGLDGAEEEFGQESTRVMQDDVVQRLAEKTRDKPPAEAFSDEITRARGPDELAHLLRASGPSEPADSNDKTSVDEQALPALPPRAPAPPVISSAAPPPPPAKAPETKPTESKPSDKFIEPVTRADTPVLAPPVARTSSPPPPASTPELPAAPRPVEQAPPAVAALEIGHHAMANERPPSRKKSSPMPVILGIVGVAAAAAVYVMFSGNHSGTGATVATNGPGDSKGPAKQDAPAEVKPAALPPAAAGEPTQTGSEPKTAAVTPPATEKPSAPQGPTVEVSSVPPGAVVTVDGKPHDATTPTTLVGLDPKKSYEVAIALKGYRDWKGKVQPKEGAKVEAKLVANEKVVEVSSTPAGADLFLDGKKVGRTPYTIRKFDVTSEHKLEVRRGGFVAQTRSVAASDTWESRPEGRDVLAVAMTLEAEAPKAKPTVASGRHPVVAGGKKPDGTPPGERVTPERVTPENVDKPVGDKPVDKPAEPVDKPTDKTDKPADKPADKTDKPADKPEEEKVKLPRPPAEKPGEGAQPE